MALCTQDDVEKVLQVDFGNPADPVVAFLIANAGAAFERAADRKLEAVAGIVELHDPPWPRSGRLYVRQPPINAVTSVEVDGVLLVAGVDDDYLVHGNYLLRRGARWSAKPLGIRVVYDGGFVTVPFDVRQAVAQMVGRAFTAGAAALVSVGLESEGIGTYRASYRAELVDPSGMPAVTAAEMALALSLRPRLVA